MNGGHSQEERVNALAPLESEAWYAFYTRSRHEHAVAHRLCASGLTTFLPLVTEVHRWSDRRKRVETPLFPCYLFVRAAMRPEIRRSILYVDGVLGVIGARDRGTPIPDEQIDAVRTVMEQKVACSAHPFLKTGQRVRIRGGALHGIEGIFLSKNGEGTLVISLEATQRSLAVRISGYEVEAI